MKIFCVGRNYVDHAKELNNPVPENPLIFIKPSTALSINSKPFYYPFFTKNLHYEGEIVLKVNNNGKHIAPEFASRYYDEISLGFDLTARDIQDECKAKGWPWEIAKGFDGSAVVGKFISLKNTASPILFSITKNGKTVQQGNTDDMTFSFENIVAHISTYFTLHKGDLIFTGTPAGVGSLQIGDSLSGSIGNTELVSFKVK